MPSLGGGGSLLSLLAIVDREDATESVDKMNTNTGFMAHNIVGRK